MQPFRTSNEPFAVLKGPQSYVLLETTEIKPAPRVCRGSRYGMVCLSRRPQQSVLTEIDGAQWVVRQRREHLPVMHEVWWTEDLDHGLGYANGRWSGQESQAYFFGRSLCLLGTAPLPHGMMQATAGAQGWYLVGQDERVYAYAWDGQPRWQWRRPPMIRRRREELLEFQMGEWRRPPLIAAHGSELGVSSGAQLRCLDANGTELWCQTLPKKSNPTWNLTEDMLRARLASLSAPCGQPQNGKDAVGYFRWEWDARQPEPSWGQCLWTREDNAEEDADGGNDIEVVTALAVTPQTVYAGTCDGEVLGWTRQGNPQTRLRIGEAAVWSVCADEHGLRAAQSGNAVTYFHEGKISGSSSHQYERPSVAALANELVLWTRHETWTVDERGAVPWVARWDKPVAACVPAEGGFTVMAGSGVYRFGGAGRQTHGSDAPAAITTESIPEIRKLATAEQAERDQPGTRNAPDASERRYGQPVATGPQKGLRAGRQRASAAGAAKRAQAGAQAKRKRGKPVGGKAEPETPPRHGSPGVQSGRTARAASKKARILELVQRRGGATMQDLRSATGCKAHTLRAFLSAVLRKQMGLTVKSSKGTDGQRSYWVAG
jgi:outer membrane protein assembly factor BamB